MNLKNRCIFFEKKKQMKLNLISFILVFNSILLFTFASLPELPNGGKAILPTKECRYLTKEEIGICNDHHYSENLDNHMKCPPGTKAWPLMFPWELQYHLADGNPLPDNP